MRFDYFYVYIACYATFQVLFRTSVFEVVQIVTHICNDRFLVTHDPQSFMTFNIILLLRRMNSYIHALIYS
jgi:hypothetical protein